MRHRVGLDRAEPSAARLSTSVPLTIDRPGLSRASTCCVARGDRDPGPTTRRRSPAARHRRRAARGRPPRTSSPPRLAATASLAASDRTRRNSRGRAVPHERPRTPTARIARRSAPAARLPRLCPPVRPRRQEGILVGGLRSASSRDDVFSPSSPSRSPSVHPRGTAPRDVRRRPVLTMLCGLAPAGLRSRACYQRGALLSPPSPIGDMPASCSVCCCLGSVRAIGCSSAGSFRPSSSAWWAFSRRWWPASSLGRAAPLCGYAGADPEPDCSSRAVSDGLVLELRACAARHAPPARARSAGAMLWLSILVSYYVVFATWRSGCSAPHAEIDRCSTVVPPGPVGASPGRVGACHCDAPSSAIGLGEDSTSTSAGL